jgi:phytoene desaturase
MKVAIIGAGFAGLSAGVLLQNAGYQVEIFEKNSSVGGRARRLTQSGFKFDMGPSWLLMPDVYKNFYKQIGLDFEKEINVKRLEPSYKIFWGKNDADDVFSDMQKLSELFEKYEEGSSKKLEEYLKIAKQQYDLSMTHVLYKDFNSFLDLFSFEFIKASMKMKVLQSLDNFAKKYFKSDRIRKLLEYNIVFLGGSPSNTPALYSLINYIDYVQGVYYPEGGLYSLVESMTKIFEAKNGKIHYDSNVDSFGYENKKITSVNIKNKKYKFDLVLSAVDSHYLETHVLEPQYRSYSDSSWKRSDIAPSAFIVYLGLNKKLKNISHHNLIFSYDWMEHFADIFDRKILPQKPSIYLCTPSVADPSVAPKGCENLFVTVPIPAGIKIQKSQVNSYKEKLINIIEEVLDQRISDSVIFEKIFTIDDFTQDYNAFNGTALGLSHTLKQSLFWRIKRKSKKLDNLYYTGQYTHPGIGVPMAVISGELAYKRILHDYPIANN